MIFYLVGEFVNFLENGAFFKRACERVLGIREERVFVFVEVSRILFFNGRGRN